MKMVLQYILMALSIIWPAEAMFAERSAADFTEKQLIIIIYEIMREFAVIIILRSYDFRLSYLNKNKTQSVATKNVNIIFSQDKIAQQKYW